MIMPRSVLLTIYFSDKVCTEKNNTHFTFSNIFEKVPLCDNVSKYEISREVTDNTVILGHVIHQSLQYMCIYFKLATKRVPISEVKCFKSIFNTT